MLKEVGKGVRKIFCKESIREKEVSEEACRAKEAGKKESKKYGTQYLKKYC